MVTRKIFIISAFLMLMHTIQANIVGIPLGYVNTLLVGRLTDKSYSSPNQREKILIKKTLVYANSAGLVLQAAWSRELSVSFFNRFAQRPTYPRALAYAIGTQVACVALIHGIPRGIAYINKKIDDSFGKSTK